MVHVEIRLRAATWDSNFLFKYVIAVTGTGCRLSLKFGSYHSARFLKDTVILPRLSAVWAMRRIRLKTFSRRAQGRRRIPFRI